MQEFIDKLIGRLEEKADDHRERGFLMERTGFSSMADKQYAKQTAYLNTIEIINELAEEHNNGHFGCNSNGEHEKCEGCGMNGRCPQVNKHWFSSISNNNGWIPVKQRPCKTIDGCNMPVLTLDINGEMAVMNYNFATDKFVFFNKDCTESVVYWMPRPLPPAYKEGCV